MPGGLRQGKVGKKADEDGADDGGYGGGDIDRAVADAQDIGAVVEGIREHAGVDHQNIGHRHEGRQAGHQLRANGRAVLLQFKEFFHFLTSFLLFLGEYIPLRCIKKLVDAYVSIIQEKNPECKNATHDKMGKNQRNFRIK